MALFCPGVVSRLGLEITQAFAVIAPVLNNGAATLSLAPTHPTREGRMDKTAQGAYPFPSARPPRQVSATSNGVAAVRAGSGCWVTVPRARTALVRFARRALFDLRHVTPAGKNPSLTRRRLNAAPASGARRDPPLTRWSPAASGPSLPPSPLPPRSESV